MSAYWWFTFKCRNKSRECFFSGLKSRRSLKHSSRSHAFRLSPFTLSWLSHGIKYRSNKSKAPFRSVTSGGGGKERKRKLPRRKLAFAEPEKEEKKNQLYKSNREAFIECRKQHELPPVDMLFPLMQFSTCRVGEKERERATMPGKQTESGAQLEQFYAGFCVEDFSVFPCPLRLPPSTRSLIYKYE